MCPLWSRSCWDGSGCGGRPYLCELLSQSLPEGLLVHWNLSFACGQVLVEEEGIHSGNVDEMIKERLVPLLRLVKDLVIPYQSIR